MSFGYTAILPARLTLAARDATTRKSASQSDGSRKKSELVKKQKSPARRRGSSRRRTAVLEREASDQRAAARRLEQLADHAVRGHARDHAVGDCFVDDAEAAAV